jgi:hypothetical protein
MTEEPTNPAPAVPNENASEPTPVERLIAVEPETSELSFTPYNDPIRRKKPWALMFLAGVFLPGVVFLIELATGICAKTFFDPMPTVWHALIVAFVPAGNLYLYLQLRRDDFEYRRRHGVINGIIIIIAGVYALLYAPLMPIAIVALVFMGAGLLPMAPALALIASLFYTKHLRRAMAEQRARQSVYAEDGPARLRGLGYGLACGVLALFLAEGLRTITYIGLDMAASTDAARSLQGVRLLRAVGHEGTMLAACRGRSREFGSPFGSWNLWGDPVPLNVAQIIFYRVTGKTYGSVRANNGVAAAFESDTSKLDPDGTGEIGGADGRNAWLMDHLSLASSRMDGTLDPDAALGYLEWMMVFKNTSSVQQEAVSQVQLPPGGVVSRLTLWVNGEEREAAFAGKGKVQAAYDAVVRARRDPVIVQSLGGDRISVRCFPVPPNGEMKIRFGVTAPMQFEAGNEVWMRLPHFIERNFTVRRETQHAVWFEAKQALESSTGSLKPEHPSEKLFAVRGALPHAELAKDFPAIRAHRTAAITEAWTRNPHSPSGEIIRQRIEPQATTAPQRTVFVLDGSIGMSDYAAPLAEALARLPERGEFAIVAASDEVIELEPMQPASAANLRDAAKQVRDFSFTGGQNNWPALARAWDLASQQPDSAIVWIHEPAPLRFDGGASLLQRWHRRPGGPRLFDVQTRKGTNSIGEEIGAVSAVKTIARLGGLGPELTRMFEHWRNGDQRFAVTREKLLARNFTAPAEAKETSAHLARLWAFSEVTRLAGIPSSSDQATQLAATYQLVTPLTGAVVLETAAQYERAGLEPVKAGATPTVPEPEEWALMITVTLVLLWMWYQRRRSWQMG